MDKVIKENITKNVLLIILLILSYFPIKQHLIGSSLLADKVVAGNLLLAVSIFIVIACFGNFAFTYEKINIRNNFERYFAHFLTGLLVFIIGINLILTSMLIYFILGRLFLIDLILFLLYLACVGYDFFDLFKTTHNSYKV
jgi:hypothetical protein